MLFAIYFLAKSQIFLINSKMSLIIVFVTVNFVYCARAMSVNGSMPTIPRRRPVMSPWVSCCCLSFWQVFIRTVSVIRLINSVE